MKISDFNLRQAAFRYLQSFHLARNFNVGKDEEDILIITLCDYPFYEGDQKLVITFTNIKDLKVGDVWGIVDLEINILDISDHQLEGLKYRVKEEEYELFSFHCKSFDFEIL
ncbi:hypothetical protein [Paenibacillus sp. FSL H8-0537]|uniref:hypothetical protein n=1 Tax=Paenibacillus sp. FSL H8-0537 TaxID=2921399 RepID=UPI0031016FA5